MELLEHHYPSVQASALRIVGNIATGNEEQIQTLISCGLVPKLRTLCGHPKKSIKKESIWTISNLTAGRPIDIQAVIDANIFTLLIQELINQEFDVQKEILWALSNALSGGTDDQIQYLISQGVIQPICDKLRVWDKKATGVGVALTGLESILKIGARSNTLNQLKQRIEDVGGLDLLKTLIDHQDQQISETSRTILNKYF